jgi:hypothetical protein
VVREGGGGGDGWTWAGPSMRALRSEGERHARRPTHEAVHSTIPRVSGLTSPMPTCNARVCHFHSEGCCFDFRFPQDLATRGG